MLHAELGSGTRLRYRLIGDVAATVDGDDVAIGGPKQRLVLAMLVLEIGQLVSLDRLIDGVWGSGAPARVEASLHSYVSNLRAALGPPSANAGTDVIRRAGRSYQLAGAPEQVDLLRFVQSVAAAERRLGEGAHAAAGALLEEAFAIWPDGSIGTWAADLSGSAILSRARSRWDQARRHLFDIRLETGDHRSLIADLEGAIHENPLDEGLRILFAQALYRDDRAVEALRSLSEARAMLAEEVGVDPSPRLREVERAILEHDESLTASRPGVQRPTPQHEPPTLIGRDEAMAAIAPVVAALRRGDGGALVVSGEPGIGKTTLVKHVVSALAADGVATAWARCPESTGSAPYGPMIQAAQQLCAAGALEGLDQLFGADPSVDPEAARITTHLGVAATLRRARSTPDQPPCLIVIDDLQWADSATLSLLEYVVAELGSTSTLVIAIVRPSTSETPPAVTDCLAEFARAQTTRVQLEGLTEPAIHAWLTSTIGMDAATRSAAAIHARTGGNPFFVRELLSLMRTGDQDVVGATVPIGVRDVVRRRVSRLPPTTQRLLSAAAVVGRRFDIEVLAAVCDTTLDSVLDALQVAELAGFVEIVAEQPGIAAFTHALVGESLAGEQSAVSRARLHAAITTALERRHAADTAPVLEALAHHAFAGATAGTARRAVDHCSQAASAATISSAFADAVRHLERALGALQLADPADRIRRQQLLAELGVAQSRAGNVFVGRATVVEAAEIAERLGDVDGAARILVRVNADDLWASIDWTERDDRAVGVITRILHQLPPGDGEHRAGLLAALGGQLYYAGSPLASDDASREAVEIAERLGDPQLLARVLVQRNWVSWRPSGNAARHRVAERLLELAAAGIPEQFVPLAHLVEFFAAYEVFDVDRAEESLRRARATADPRRTPSAWTYVLYADVSLQLVRGEYARAESTIETFHDAMRRSRRMIADLSRGALLAQLHAELGDTDRALAALEIADTTAYQRSIPWFRAWILAEGGRLDAAAEQLRSFDGEVPDDWYRPLILTCALHAAVSVGMSELAERCAVGLRPIEGLLAAAGSGGVTIGPVALALARAAHAAGDTGEAARLADIAIDRCRRLGALPWLDRAERLRAVLAE